MPSLRTVPPALASLELESATGERIRLGSLWNERKVVLAFLRHFG